MPCDFFSCATNEIIDFRYVPATRNPQVLLTGWTINDQTISCCNCMMTFAPFCFDCCAWTMPTILLTTFLLFVNFELPSERIHNRKIRFDSSYYHYYRAMLCIRCTSHGCPSVRPSQVGVLLKRINVGSQKLHHTIAHGL